MQIEIQVLLKVMWNTIIHNHTYTSDHISGVMVSMLAVSVVDRGFEPQSSQT